MDAIDTSILIWGVKKASPPDRPDMVERCVALIESLSKNRARIMLPSVVVAEYLTDFPFEQQEAQYRVLERHFFIAPFDAAGAAIAAQIYSRRRWIKLRPRTR